MRERRETQRIFGVDLDQASTETTLDNPLFTYCLEPGNTGIRRLIGFPTACTRLSRIPATILEGFNVGMVEPPRKVLPLLPLVVVELEVKLVIRRLGEEEVEYRLISVGAAAGMWIVRGKAESEDMEGSCRRLLYVEFGMYEIRLTCELGVKGANRGSSAKGSNFT